MSLVLDPNRKQSADGCWNQRPIKLSNVYGRTSLTGNPWRVATRDANRESGTSSSIESRLQAVLDAENRQHVFSAGVAAVNWLKTTELKHQKLYLQGFARELKKQAKTVDLVTPNAIVGLEVLTTFNSQDALSVVLQEIVKRPISEEHLYLVGLAHDLNLPADNDKSGDLYLELAKLLRESLSESTVEPWQSHISVEVCRVLANGAPERLIGDSGNLLINVGELEMPAVLDAFLVAAAKQKNHTDLGKWKETASIIWARYSADPSLTDAEGVLARLLNYDLLAGESVDDIISKVEQFDASTATDAMYLLGIDGPKTGDQNQLVQFYKYLASRLISEGQSKALSRILSNVLKYDIQVNEILTANP